MDLKRAFLIFAVLMVLAEVSNRILFVIFPYYVLDNGFTATELGLIFTFASFVILLSRSFIGKLSDLSGRKWILCAGLLMNSVATALYPLATRFVHFASIKTLADSSGTLRYSVEDAMLADTFPKRPRRLVLARLGALFPASRALGALVGFLAVTYLTITQSFWIAASFGILAFLVIALFFNEPRHHGPSHLHLMFRFSKPPLSPQLKRLIVVGSFQTLAFQMAYTPAFFVLARSIGLPENGLFQLLLVNYLAGACVVWLLNRRIHRAEKRGAMLFALGLTTLGSFGYVFVRSPMELLPALLAYSMGFWVYRIAWKTLLLESTDKKVRGEQIGRSRTVFGFAEMAGPAAGGFLVDAFSLQAAFLVATFSFVIALAMGTTLAVSGKHA